MTTFINAILFIMDTQYFSTMFAVLLFLGCIHLGYFLFLKRGD